MQRTVPHTSTDTINLFMRTYYSLLRTTDAIPIQSLVESYLAMESSLHTHARNEAMDVSALVYTGLRLPACITEVDMVLLGQTEDVFEKNDYPVGYWARVTAPGRRRRVHWNTHDTLAVFISSRSDIDDLLPMLTSYQIEWNKIYDRLHQSPFLDYLQRCQNLEELSQEEFENLAALFRVPPSELRRLERALGSQLLIMLKNAAQHRKHFRLRQLAGSLAEYRKATARWWANVRESARPYDLDLENVPVYFLSSNLHSMVNLVSGSALQEREPIIQFLHEAEQHALLKEYENVQSDELLAANEPNFLYYVLKKFTDVHPEASQRRQEAQTEIGIVQVPSRRGFDIGAQVIALNRLRYDFLDPRLQDIADFNLLRGSEALIINIDYPLGVSAYELLSHLSARVGSLVGVYIMGKAATLNGAIGDAMIPNVVHDEHSQNTYLFVNAFSARQVAPYMVVGSVLDNQKAVASYGTFLQNPSYMDVFYQEGYTVIEMEAGPYLSALYESVRPRRHPNNEVVRLYEADLDIGVIHYASDTPFSRGHNLGAGSLGYIGMEPTYAASIAIMRRVITQEIKRLKG